MTKFVSSNWFAAKSVEQMRVEQSQFEQFTPTHKRRCCTDYLITLPNLIFESLTVNIQFGNLGTNDKINRLSGLLFIFILKSYKIFIDWKTDFQIIRKAQSEAKKCFELIMKLF